MFGGLELKGEEETTGTPAVSAFGFLNAEPSDTNDAPASGFSFLNTTVAAPEPAPMLSGFSFLQPEVTTEVASAPQDTTVESGFSFMIPSPDKGYEVIEQQPSSSPPAAPMSAFSFLSAVPSQDEAEAMPPPATSAPTSRYAPSPVPSDTGLPTGAGITFGTAKQPAVRKKKTRAQKIGMGAPPPPAPMPPPPAVAAPLSVSVPTATSSSRPRP